MTVRYSVHREALLFLTVGAFAAAANFASRIAFSYVAPFPIAVTLAFFVGLTTAFVLNRRIVFPRAADAPIVASATKFTVVNLFGLVLTLGVSVTMLRYVLPVLDIRHASEELAHVAGIGATTVTSYFAHKLWTFKT